MMTSHSPSGHIRLSETEKIISFLDDTSSVALALKEQRLSIESVIDVLFQSWRRGNPVFIVGNGGSASTATHFASDLFKTVIEKPGQKGIAACALVDNIPLMSALINDWGWQGVYEEQLRTLWKPDSVVIALSVHGGSGSDIGSAWSENLLRALEFANVNEGTSIGITGFGGGVFKNLAHISIVIPAFSTPLVESFHVLLHHLITFRLKDMIKREYQEGRGL